jgi:RNA polymerase sigma factor (sigma-70 family)
MSGRLADVLGPIQTKFQLGAVSGMSDGQLLHLFTTRSDEAAAEAAFGALVERHGPLVLRVCRDVLGDEHAAEDVFQATFLVLARRASSIRNADSVAGWLCRIARRVAAKSRANAACRRARERSCAEMAARRTAVRDRAETWPELYEELDRLPEKYRAPLVLCYLMGLTYEQAAGQLNCPVRTVQIRLIRGRKRLHSRLVRRGLGPAAGSLWMASTTEPVRASVPAALTELTARAALRFAADGTAGAASRLAVSLAEGILKTMLFTKLKAATAAVVLGFGLAGLGARLAAHGSAADQAGDGGVPKAAPRGANEKGAWAGPVARKVVTDTIAWGKAVDGLQAGIGFRDGETGSYQAGQAANFVMYLRNTGDKDAGVTYIETVFEEFLPAVEDVGGKPYKVLNGPIYLGEVSTVTRTLGKGESIRLGTAWFMILAPGTKGVATAPTLVAPPGTYRVRLSGFPLRRPGRDSDEQKWATGTVEIRIDGPGDAPKAPKPPAVDEQNPHGLPAGQ